MFTGLIETIGRIVEDKTRSNYRVLRVESALPAAELTLGESIACSGPCLTVTGKAENWFEVEMSQETIARTVTGKYETGRQLNLERALRAGDRLGGHFVSGHIDGVGSVVNLKRIGDSLELSVSFDKCFESLVVDKGSVAIDGVSLTVNQSLGDTLTVNLIPHSVSSTTLADLKARDKVNLEFDLIGKYILKYSKSAETGGLTVDTLTKSGW